MSGENLFPQRPSSHVSGDIAIALFSKLCPSEWIISPIQKDYGLDLRVELTLNGQVLGTEFFVQVKGKKSVTPDDRCLTYIQVPFTTVNYWLGKLHPVMIALVDTTKERIWFDWLEYAYADYPNLLKNGNCRLALSKEGIFSKFQSDVIQYVDQYFSLLKEDAAKLFENTQLTRVLMHISLLYRCCAEMVIFLEQAHAVSIPQKDIDDKFHHFFFEFGTHDQFLMGVWSDFDRRQYDRFSKWHEHLKPKINEYIAARDKFFMSKHAQEAGDFLIVPIKWSKLHSDLFPMVTVLGNLQEFLFRLLQFGEIVFPKKTSAEAKWINEHPNG